MRHLIGLAMFDGRIDWEFRGGPPGLNENEDCVQITLIWHHHEKLRTRQILKVMASLLEQNGVNWITASESAWTVDADQMKGLAQELTDVTWLSGRYAVQPEVEVDVEDVYGVPDYEASLALYVTSACARPIKVSENSGSVPSETPKPRSPKYDVALSFAGEDRPYVEQVAEHLVARGIKVFYDDYEKADMWGKDLYAHLSDVYLNKAQYTLIFISKHYKGKIWPRHERAAAQARALLEESREYILPARFDDTDIPGVLPTTRFVDLRSTQPVEVAVLVCRKLGRDPLAQKAHDLPSPQNRDLSGEASFDYSSYNGRFRIGSGQFEFETRWTKASDKSIYCYTDSPSVRAVALTPNGATIENTRDASHLDFTSRVRTVGLGRVVVIQNHHGVYAALQILDIKDDSRGAAQDFLRFRYRILTDGSDDFSAGRTDTTAGG